MAIKKSERKLLINSFRNIGFNNDKPINEPLVLNYSTKPELLGDLVILIGTNNSGKTNVIRSLLALEKKEISKDDINDSHTNSKMRNPSITYQVNEGNNHYSITLNNENQYIYDLEHYPFEKDFFEVSRYFPQNQIMYGTLINSYKSLIQFLSQNGIQIFNSFLNKPDGSITPQEVYNNLRKTTKYIIDLIIKGKMNNNLYMQMRRAPYFNNVFNALDQVKKSICPKIINYVEKVINNADLKCNPDELDKNEFFKTIFTIMKFDISEIKTIYDDFRTFYKGKNLTDNSEKLTKLLEKTSNYFSEMYPLEGWKYRFGITLLESGIYFTLARYNEKNDEDSLILEHQSSGFRWFFNLYFNLLASSEFNAGDIITMDEPGNNLQIKSQEYLRKFLKQFAIDNKVTIIISTQLPSLINLDYLDEIRIVKLDNHDFCQIKNLFYVADPFDAQNNNQNKSDTLMGIKKALTVRTNAIIDPNSTVVFVEGITDYNYLVAMKYALGEEYKKLIFLPINGLGHDSIKEKIKLEEMQKIRKYDSILLTDSDSNGRVMRGLILQSGKGPKVISLHEVNDKFVTIESLFSDNDKKEFNINKKDWMGTAFKKMIIRRVVTVDEETKNNFKQLFNYFKQVIDNKNN